jgi:hypothetical protein
MLVLNLQDNQVSGVIQEDNKEQGNHYNLRVYHVFLSSTNKSKYLESHGWAGVSFITDASSGMEIGGFDVSSVSDVGKLRPNDDRRGSAEIFVVLLLLFDLCPPPPRSTCKWASRRSRLSKDRAWLPGITNLRNLRRFLNKYPCCTVIWLSISFAILSEHIGQGWNEGKKQSKQDNKLLSRILQGKKIYFQPCIELAVEQINTRLCSWGIRKEASVWVQHRTIWFFFHKIQKLICFYTLRKAAAQQDGKSKLSLSLQVP